MGAFDFPTCAGYWWFGFDTGHAGDLSPSIVATMKTHGIVIASKHDTYKTIDYVIGEVNKLAEQLARGARRRKHVDETGEAASSDEAR
jgi:hypothetical protein